MRVGGPNRDRRRHCTTPSSTNNAFAGGGPPDPRRTGPIVVVDRRESDLRARWLTECDLARVFHNGLGIDNEAQGDAIYVCEATPGPWATIWPDMFTYY